MDGALGTAFVALVAAVPLLVVLFVPLVAITYRRGRRPGLLGALGAAAVVVYGIALWAYTVLPPPRTDPCLRPAEPQLRPLQFVADMADPTSPVSWLRDPSVTVTVLNVALFVPLGVGVAWVVRRRAALAALVVGLGVSLTIELVQLTGTLGLYDCAYRIFDVDDLLTNTAGALLGTAAAPLVRAWRRDRDRAPDEQLTTRRRLLGVVIDVFLLMGSAVTLTVVVVSAGRLVDPGSALGRLARADELPLLTLGVPALGLLVLVPLLSHGTTPGRWVVLLRAVDRDGAPAGPVRTTVLVLTGVGGLALAWTFVVGTGREQEPVVRAVLAAWVLLGVVLLPRGDHRGLSGRLAGVHYVDARAADRRLGVPDWTVRIDPDVLVRLLALTLAATYAVLVGSVWLLAGLAPGAPVGLVPVIGTLAASQLLASGFLVVNGARMLLRESWSLGNLLSLLAGLGSVGLIALSVLVLLESPGPLRAVVVALSVVASYLSALFGGFVLVGRRFGRAPLRGDVPAIVVLGSRVIGDRVPPLLADRLEAGRRAREEAVAAGSDPVIVCTGGQGPGETVSEGSAMRRWLIERGVPDDVVLAEEEARTTRENLELSFALLDARTGAAGEAGETGEGTPVVVTNGYHVLRAATIAKDLEVRVVVRAARTAAYFLPSALLREFVAVLLRDRALHAVLVVALATLAVLAAAV